MKKIDREIKDDEDNSGLWLGQLEMKFKGDWDTKYGTATLITKPKKGKAWCISCAHNFTKREQGSSGVT